MEKWALNHPKLGLIELEVGYDSEFLELDPTWPEEPKADEEIRPVTADSGLKERFSALFSNPFSPGATFAQLPGPTSRQYCCQRALPSGGMSQRRRAHWPQSRPRPRKTSCEGHSEFLR